MQEETEILALPLLGKCEFGENTQQFLSRVKPSTKRVYTVAFNLFANYLASQGEKSIDDFIFKVDAEARRPLIEGKRDYTERILIGFNLRLQRMGLANKSVRTYLASLLGLAEYLKVDLTLAYVGLPKDRAQVITHQWADADEVGKFLKLFKLPAYQCLGRLLFQSGLSLSDALSLTWADIEKEFGEVSPMLLDFRYAGRSKTGVSFLTFCGKWTIQALIDYLKDKTLYPNSRLFNLTVESCDTYFKMRARDFVGKWPGKTNPASPHSLRHGFRSIIHKAIVTDKIMTETDLEFFMGHGSTDTRMENTYTTLNPNDWRQIYQRAERVLSPNYVEL